MTKERIARIPFWFLISIICLLPLSGKGQISPIYISGEIGGNGMIGSVSFAKPLVIHPDYDIVLQWGLGWTPNYVKSSSPVNLPSQLYLKYGRKAVAFELGVGSTILFQCLDPETSARSSEFYLSPVIGLRHETRSWFIRVFACPLFHISGPESRDAIAKEFASVGIGLGVVL